MTCRHGNKRKRVRVVSRNESGVGVSVKLLLAFTRTMTGGILQGNVFLLSMKWSERGYGSQQRKLLVVLRGDRDGELLDVERNVGHTL